MKQKLWMLLFFVGCLSPAVNAQKCSLQSSLITFYSDAPVEDITAKSERAKSILNTTTNEIVFLIPINTFEFEKKLMREHFNEKYMESEKFPQSVFSGKVVGFELGKQEQQQVTVKGKLTIHGVPKEVAVTGNAKVDDNKIIMQAGFLVLLKDYDIEIPQLLWQNIAEEIKVSVTFTYSR